MIKFFLKSLMLPLQDIDAALPRAGMIYDLGCGEGIVSFYLARSTPQRQVIGIDLDINKISRARPLPNLKFIHADLTQINLHSASGCLLSDVLHHLSPRIQRQLLHQISRELKPGSVCVIKEINAADTIRSKLSRFWDWIFYPQDKIYYWRAQDLVKTMKQLGFKVKFTPAMPWFPGSTNLFVCIKP